MLFDIAVLGAAAALGFCIWRVRGRTAVLLAMAREALLRAVSRVRIWRAAQAPSLATVDDPAAAAAAMLIALASPTGGLSAAAEALIKGEMLRVMHLREPDAVFALARRLAGHVNDPNELSIRFAELWTRSLTTAERFDFYKMASRVVAADGAASDAQRQALAWLKLRLDLTGA
jgi:uncharacterized tellurite resistance protein B-like protein